MRMRARERRFGECHVYHLVPATTTTTATTTTSSTSTTTTSTTTTTTSTTLETTTTTYAQPTTTTTLAEGILESTHPNCRILWWYDNENPLCQRQEFCGSYTYEGLKTFNTLRECLTSRMYKNTVDKEETEEGD